MVYVTSDWHGYPLEKIKELFSKANFSQDDYCFVLGDVIDRGGDGVKLLEWLMLQPNIQLILGNHETFLLSNLFLFNEVNEDTINQLNSEQIELFQNWMENGGRVTVDALRKLPKDTRADIVDYVMEAPLYESISVNGKDFLLTHSALDNFEKCKSLTDYSEHDFLWHRASLEEKFYDDVICVFGHTPTALYGSKYRGKILKTDSWIDIDTGASGGFPPALLRLDDMKEFYLED